MIYASYKDALFYVTYNVENENTLQYNVSLDNKFLAREIFIVLKNWSL